MAGTVYVGEFIWQTIIDMERRREMFKKGEHHGKKEPNKKMVPKEPTKKPGKVPGPGPSKKGKVKDY
jgi:hypothetical protein